MPHIVATIQESGCFQLGQIPTAVERDAHPTITSAFEEFAVPTGRRLIAVLPANFAVPSKQVAFTVSLVVVLVHLTDA